MAFSRRKRGSRSFELNDARYSLNAHVTTELEQRIKHQLSELDLAGLRRSMRTPKGIDLSSNDYLGLAAHPAIKQRMSNAVLIEGCGSTGSRLLRGQRHCFSHLEDRFACWKGTEAALFFGSGYLANIAVLSTFPGEGDVVFSDELNHASLIDGIRLSRARCVVFGHNDIDELTRLIERENPTARQKFLVAESLFSMDGDEAPLTDYAALCRATGTLLIVDEAHAVGIYGADGSGLIEEIGIEKDVFISINTAGKALGVGGAFVAGPDWAIDYLVQRARPFIFSTAPPPAMSEAIDAALDCLDREVERRSKLIETSVYLRDLLKGNGVSIGRGLSQIIPVVIGDSEHTVLVAESLQAQGYDVRAIRPPSVPAGTSRLRISVNVGLSKRTLSDFAQVLTDVLEKCAYVPV
jgi:8-amino-7-oxononanoate synthase